MDAPNLLETTYPATVAVGKLQGGAGVAFTAQETDRERIKVKAFRTTRRTGRVPPYCLRRSRQFQVIEQTVFVEQPSYGANELLPGHYGMESTMRAWMPIWLVVGAALGCTQGQLRHSTVGQITTLTELQHQIVLDNLAAFACNPETIPFQANLTQGTTQVVDVGAVSSQVLRSALLNLGLSRGVVDQWSMVPITDEATLRLLRVAYRRALGFDEDLYTDDFANQLAHRLKVIVTGAGDVSQANTIMYSRGPGLPQLLDRAGWKGEGQHGFKPDDLAVKRWKKDVTDIITLGSDRIIQDGERLTPDILTITPVLANGVPILAPGEKDPRVMVATPYATEVRRQVMSLNDYLLEIQPSWVHRGCKRDVPKCVCYVGHHKECHCDCWVWVADSDRASFEDFVLRTMRLSSLVPQPNQGPGGAIYSPIPAAAF
jgi:hypothetical protein